MLSVEIDTADFSRQLDRAGRELRDIDMGRTLKVCSLLIRNELKRDMQAGRSPDGTPYKALRFPRPNGKSSPLWDTGMLARSLGAGVGHVETISGDTLEIGTNLEYAALHQYGGTVTPKNVQWLTIPLTMEAKRAGGARNFPRPLAFVPLGRGKAALRETRQKKGKAKSVTQYLLVKKVDVPARPFIGWSDALIKQIEQVVAKAITKD